MMHPLLSLLLAGQAPLDLESCVNGALQVAENVELQRARVDEARSFERQARTWPNPVFTALAQDVGLQQHGQSPLVLQQTLSFPVFFAYTRVQEQRVAAAGVTQARAGVEEDRRQLRWQAGRAYFDTLLLLELLGVEEDGVLLTEKRLAQTRQRASNGEDSPVDVQRALAEHLDAQRTAELARRRHDGQALVLSALLGAQGATPHMLARSWRLPNRLAVAIQRPDATTLRARLLASRPDLVGARAAVTRFQEQHLLERQKIIPLADVLVSVSARQSALGTGGVVAVSAPVPAFDRNQGPRERALAATNAAHAALARAERQAILELEAAVLEWQRAEAALTAFAAPTLRAREETLTAVERQFVAGAANLTDVIVARRDVLAARRSFVQAQYDAALAAWRLVTVLGLE